MCLSCGVKKSFFFFFKEKIHLFLSYHIVDSRIAVCN